MSATGAAGGLGKIAFHAPLKPPGHAVPSGDRTVARLLLAALRQAGYEPSVATRFSSYDGVGDPARQAGLVAQAHVEAMRLIAALRPSPPVAFVTYHNYYKAPDLIGPQVAAALGIAYVQVEASHSPRRLAGPWADFGHLCAKAIGAADLHVVLNGRDVAGLKLAGAGRLLRLPPFLDITAWPAAAAIAPDRPALALIAIGMMRPGDKLASYFMLADALACVKAPWQLVIAGDGRSRAEVERVFAPFGERVRLVGQVDQPELARLIGDADLLAWPGINEAFGMAYLEAASRGRPAVAFADAGVPEAVADGVSGVLVPGRDPAALATALTRLAADRKRLAALGVSARNNAVSRHSLHGAAMVLGAAMGELLGARAQ